MYVHYGNLLDGKTKEKEKSLSTKKADSTHYATQFQDELHHETFQKDRQQLGLAKGQVCHGSSCTDDHCRYGLYYHELNILNA